MSTQIATATGTYSIDASHSRIGFVARHAMITKVRGSFEEYEGTGTFDAEQPANSSLSITIQAGSITTLSADRDGHLRSADFFDVETYPTITFASSAVESTGGDSYRVSGDLTMKGITHPVSFELKIAGTAIDPFGNTRLGLEGSATINRKDWGLTWNAALETGGVLVSEKIKLELEGLRHPYRRLTAGQNRRRTPEDEAVNESTVMPSVFIGHGSPMNTLETNHYTEMWNRFGRSVPTPRAILAISAHWYINATAVTAMARPKTIHDFYGFPDELFAVEYRAPGSPELAAEVVELVKPTWVGLDHDSWGLDHGTWSVLAHMFPAADIPVVQLAIDASKGPDYHVALGAALEPLRRRGVLVVGSGNVVHNLRRIEWGNPEGAFDWAREFDDAARELMTERPGDVASLAGHRHVALAAPTPDHLLPLYYLGGLASASGATTEVLAQGYAMGSLSMTSYVLPGSASTG